MITRAIRKISDQPKIQDTNYQNSSLGNSINDTYYRINVAQGESINATKDYSTDQYKFKETLQDDDFRMNDTQMEKQDDQFLPQMKKRQVSKNEYNLRIDIPVIEESSDDNKQVEIKKCTSKSMIPAVFSPNSSQLSISNKRKGIQNLTLENQIISPMGSSQRIFPEERFSSPLCDIQREKGSYLQIETMKHILSQNHTKSQPFIKSRSRLKQQLSLQSGYSIPSQGNIQNLTQENLYLNGNYLGSNISNNLTVGNQILNSTPTHMLKSPMFKQSKRHLMNQSVAIKQSGSIESSPKGSLARQNSLAKLGFNFSNAVSESMNNINSSTHKFANMINFNNSNISIMNNTPMNNNSNISQGTQGPNKFSQIMRGKIQS